MEHNEASAEGGRAGVATNKVEAVVAFILLIIGIVVIYESQKLGSGWTSDGPGAGYFPFYMGIIITLSSAGVMFQSLLGKNKNNEIFVDHEQLKQVLSVLIPAGVYVLVVQFLGLYLASAIYIALFMIILGKYSWIKSVIAALAVNTLFFFMFEVWFKVPLFKGKFEPLSFLGY